MRYLDILKFRDEALIQTIVNTPDKIRSMQDVVTLCKFVFNGRREGATFEGRVVIPASQTRLDVLREIGVSCEGAIVECQ